MRRRPRGAQCRRKTITGASVTGERPCRAGRGDRQKGLACYFRYFDFSAPKVIGTVGVAPNAVTSKTKSL
jgi:hypothetical protein